MENVLERVDTRPATVVVNSGLERYEKRPVLSKKSREARDFLDAHPIPAWVFLHKYSKTQQEEGICINGILARGNVEANTFSVAVTVNKYAQSNYHIRTTPETLNKIVKTYWNQPISVQIRPQINAENQFEYELIEVKA